MPNAPPSRRPGQPPMDTADLPAYAGWMGEERSEQTRHAALNDLERLRREGDALGGSLAWLIGRGDAPEDAIELWGRRIGRTLGAVALVALCIYLYATYMR